jgi:hypothetical protein
MMFWCAITCVAQQNLFTWVDGNVVANSNYIVYEEPQLSSSMISLIERTSQTLHTYPVSSINNEYECDVNIVTNNIEDDDPYCYEQFDIKSKSGTLIYRKRGIGLPLTQTVWLSRDYNDNNYFRKIDLNNDSYALFFTGWCYGIDDDLGEMVIVVVSKNVATLVYDGPAAAITPTNFNSSSFTMDFVTDGTGLKDIETGLLDITPEKLVGKTKYRLYKDGDVLKIVSWITGNSPALP